MVFPSGQTSTDVIRPREPKPGEQEDPPQCQHLSSGTSVGSPGPSIGQVALRGGSHPPAGIHPHPLPPDAPESMAPQGTLAGDQEAHSSRKNKACGQLFHSHHFICSFEYVCVSPCVLPIPDKCEVLQDIPRFVNYFFKNRSQIVGVVG